MNRVELKERLKEFEKKYIFSPEVLQIDYWDCAKRAEVAEQNFSSRLLFIEKLLNEQIRNLNTIN